MISIHAGLVLLNVFILFYFSKISNYLNFFDFPDNDRKIHKNPISLLGGFIVYFNLILKNRKYMKFRDINKRIIKNIFIKKK